MRNFFDIQAPSNYPFHHFFRTSNVFVNHISSIIFTHKFMNCYMCFPWRYLLEFILATMRFNILSKILVVHLVFHVRAEYLFYGIWMWEWVRVKQILLYNEAKTPNISMNSKWIFSLVIYVCYFCSYFMCFCKHFDVYKLAPHFVKTIKWWSAFTKYEH